MTLNYFIEAIKTSTSKAEIQSLERRAIQEITRRRSEGGSFEDFIHAHVAVAFASAYRLNSSICDLAA